MLNREHIFEQIDAHIAAGEDERFAVLMLRVPGLREISLRFGYAQGEQAEDMAHALIQRSLRPIDRVFRAGDDGFVVLLPAIGASVLSLECSKALPDAPQGGGVILRVGDRMSIFAPALTEALRVAADEAKVHHQRKLMDGGACEATAFCASGYRASGLAVPLGNYHNADDSGPGIAPETVLVDDWLAEVDLLVALACRPQLLDPDSVEPPQWFVDRAAVAREQLGAP